MDAELVQVISDYVAKKKTFSELRAWMYEDSHWDYWLCLHSDSPESDIVAEVMMCVWARDDYGIGSDESAYKDISAEWERVRALAG